MRIRSWSWHPDFSPSEGTQFRGCWEFELKAGEKTIPHQHDDGDEITLTIEGSGRITIGDTARETQPGEVIFVPAGASHFIENPSSAVLRGIMFETGLPLQAEYGCRGERITAKDLESVIAGIPPELSESEAIQLIIRLFDLAGHLSEQIEIALGLDCETGLEALEQLERKVMQAVVRISETYQEGGSSFFRSRFS